MPPGGRKRWHIHDGPQGSLRRLRNVLAEDGCAESQFVLAKLLLEEKCGDRRAQGSPRSVCKLERRIREICNTTLQKQDDSTDEDSPDYEDTGGPSEEIRNLTVDNLVTAAVDYCQGEMPLVGYELSLTDPSVKSLDHVPLLQQAFLHPLVFIQVLYLKLLDYFGSFQFRLSNIELSLVLIAYLSVSMDSLYHLVPLVLYYVSFIAMVICTFKMFHAKRQFIDFRKWSGLFLRYSDGNLQPDESENLFVMNNIGPFLKFFLALFINLFLYPFIATQWVPFSEFCVLSFSIMFLSLLSFGTNGKPYPDMLALLSFGINVLAKYPYEKDTVVHQGWRFLDLHISNYPSYILGNSIEFCLNARMFFSLLVPIIVFFMARRSNWQGFFKYALPHCVTLSWLQMFIMCSHGCTTYGLIRGTLGLVCSFLFIPLIGVVTLTLPIFAFLQYITISRLFYTTTLVVGFGFTLGVTCILAKTESTKKFVTPFQLASGLITLLYFGNQFVMNVQDGGLPSGLIELIGPDKPSIKNLLKNEFVADYEDNSYQISWEDYYNNCNSPSWIESNMAATQMKCSVLDGAHVNWEGYIKEIELKSINNRWDDFAAWLPGFLQEYFKCYYGDEYMTLCQSDSSIKECQFVRNVARHSGKICHLNRYNEYTYEIKVIMEASGGLLKRHAEIAITYNHYFTNYTRLLHSDERIRFRGIITNEPNKYNIGTKNLNVQGYEINCLECRDARGTISSKAPSVSKFSELFKTVVNDCVVSTKNVLNFLFNPVVVFK
ncbi:hypothetical protein MSG28_014221 [Choristoneura fumiferana]|uniref:Uncharacterized protein n=1 Tax=Choristoneura fumiferana TaxID=7141 RepID=A0ACC0JG91_CHOFU|nr:hypothetical protein MSG28_014221 [Choristoneura fumiferana]